MTPLAGPDSSEPRLGHPARLTFMQRLQNALITRGNVCVGIDPHPALLEDWGLADDVDGVREFALSVVEEIGEYAAAVKPQAAFFERHGSAGVAVLEEVIAAASAAGALVIVDAKRGDIGSTMAAYADAYLADDSPLAGDAVTLSPFLGFGSLTPAFDTAARTGRGVFVLALTSNPEGPQVQHATNQGTSVAASIVAQADALNRAQGLNHVGLVIGATVGDGVRVTGVNIDDFTGPILVPGVGAQGAGRAEIDAVFGANAPRVLINVSRAILLHGRQQLRTALDRVTKGLRP